MSELLPRIRIYLALGEKDAAKDEIQKLLAIPYYLTAPRMRVDPEFRVLQGNPRFERILATANPLG